VVEALLSKRAEVNAKTIGGVSALMMASMKGHRDVVQALLAKGAAVNAKASDGETALMDASQNGYFEIVQALLAKGADFNAKKMSDGATALMLASQTGHLDVVQALLSAKADVNAKASNGATALMLASQAGHLDVVQALLGAKADVDAKASNGWTALDAATTGGHADVRALLARSLRAVGDDQSIKQPVRSTTSSAASEKAPSDTTTTQIPKVATPTRAFSIFVPVTKPGEKVPSIARVTAGKLDSIEGSTITIKSDNGSTSTFSTDIKTIFCIQGIKVDSIKDIGALNGKIVSAYADPKSETNDSEKIYTFRVEDGSPEMVINLTAKGTDGHNGTFSFPEKPCREVVR
jgi:hypothetical protein